MARIPWSFYAGRVTRLLVCSFEKKESIKSTFKKYLGTWQFDHKFLKMKHLLTINEKGVIFWDQRRLELELLKYNDQQLIFRDKYGFTLVLTSIDSQSMTLYDEAEDFTYQLTKIKTI